MRNPTHFHRFWWFLMKFHELKHKFLNNYVELEYFKNYVLLLNLFVIDLEHQIHVTCSGTKNNFWPLHYLNLNFWPLDFLNFWIFFGKFFASHFIIDNVKVWCSNSQRLLRTIILNTLMSSRVFNWSPCIFKLTKYIMFQARFRLITTYLFLFWFT